MPELTAWQKLANTLKTPIWMAGLTVLLVWLGFMLIVYVRDQLLSIFCFATASLVVFHIAFWLLRKTTDDKALKIIDYLYLGLALFGVGGIIDLQSKVATERYQAVVAHYLPDLERVKPCKNPKGKECDFAKSMLNIITTPEPMFFDATKRLLFMLSMWQQFKLSDEDTSKFVSKFEEMATELDASAIPYMRPVRSKENQFIWYYILAASLALRITKVTVELHQWQVPKEQKAVASPSAEALIAS